MNRLLEMEIFVNVVATGSISAAAEKMSLAKSAVSKRLGQLEARLGVTLLHRTTRRISLTSAGAEFYARSQTILNDVREAEASLDDASSNLTGRIRIAAPHSFGIQHLGPALLRFTAKHPDLSVDVDFNDRQVDLVAEGFDLGVRIARLEDSTLIARKLTRIRHVVCASPKYWEMHGRPAKPVDLRNHTALRYSLAKKSSWTFLAADGSRGSITVPSRDSANNGLFLAQSAAAGNGIVRLPVFIVHELIDAGRLEPVLLDFEWSPLDAWAVYPSARHVPARIRTIVDYLSKAFGERPYWEKCLSPWEELT